MLKYFANKIHPIIGLASGFVVFIVCITESIYTFKKEINHSMPHISVRVLNKPKLELSTIASSFKAFGALF